MNVERLWTRYLIGCMFLIAAIILTYGICFADTSDDWNNENNIQKEEMTDLLCPTAELIMEGGNEGYYYRADNCRIRVVFRDQGAAMAGGTYYAELDGRKQTRRYAEMNGADDVMTVIYQPDEVAGLLDDGFHEIRVYAEDAAGNQLDQEWISGTGVEMTGGRGGFILDTENPVAQLSMSAPGAANPEYSPQFGRYFLNASFSISIRISEPSGAGLGYSVRRGERTSGLYDASEDTLTDGTYLLPLSSDNGGLCFVDQVGQDGLYRYFISGCDRAGNPLVFGEGFDENGASQYFVLDTTVPSGNVELFAAGHICIRMDTSGEVSSYEEFIPSDEADVHFQTDIETEHSPTVLSGDYQIGDGPVQTVSVNDYQYGAEAAVVLTGTGRVTFGRFKIVDLAGNEILAELNGEVILDEDAPEIREFRIDASPRYENMYSGDVPVRLAVADVGQDVSGVGDVILRIFVGEVLTEERVLHERSLSVSETIQESYEDTILISGSYDTERLQLVLSAKDQAGNESRREIRLGIDSESPAAEFTFSGNESGKKGYFSGPVDVRIRIREKHFSAERVQIQVNESETEVSWEQVDEGEYEANLYYIEDGSYSLEVLAEDRLGNRSRFVPFEDRKPLVIDSCSPVVEVMYNETELSDGAAVNTKGVLSVAVQDENIDPDHHFVLADSDGELEMTFNNGVIEAEIKKEGSYQLSGYVTDLAGNRSNTIDQLLWTVDLTEPVIEIEGIENHSSNREVPKISVRFFDQHIDSEKCRLRLEAADGNEVPVNMTETWDEGIYQIDFSPERKNAFYEMLCMAEDEAGNVCERRIAFSVNLTGASFEVVDPERCGIWVNESVRPTIRIVDVDSVRILSVTMNGTEVPYTMQGDVLCYEETLEEDGKYLCGISVRDAAGYESVMKPIEYMIDRTAPSLTVETAGGKHSRYVGDVELIFTSDDPEAEYCLFEVDGQETAAEPDGLTLRYMINGTAAGRHLIRAQIRDPAGNTSEIAEQSVYIARDYWEIIFPFAAVGSICALLIFYLTGYIRRKKERKI